MKKLALAIVFCMLLFCSIADAKIIGNFSTDTTGIKTVTLDEARVNVTETTKTFDAAKPIISLMQAKQNSKALGNQSMTVSPEIHNNTFVN